MHRSTTTATLLVTAAVSALTGCTTVQAPAAPAPRATPARPAPLHPTGHSRPEVVQAPASEALALIGPSRRPGSASSATPTAPSHTSRPAPAAPRPQPQRRTPHRPAPGPDAPREPRVTVPDMARRLPGEAGGNADVCALGRRYGGWRADSQEARICDQAYGR
ncbi:hypothetical protein ACFV46_09415 [Streptomyces sp. NPDC059852]|uniref:hypothetical protein n=1 Tax=Streptomyces sp. NPDC059852 TaxID=3346972 RepID=UPI003649821F